MTEAAMTETLTFLRDGWVLWYRGRGGTTEGVMVYAQLWAEEEGGRAEVVQLVVAGRDLAGPDPTTTDVTTDRVRAVPVAHFQRLANANPNFRPHVNGTPLHPISKAFRQFQIHANRIMIDNAERKAGLEPEPQEPRKPLTRPDGSNPYAFYRQVADAYRDVLQTNKKVAVALAEEANVPVGTVHRWVLEARRRGFLPAAKQGRAG